MSKVALVVQRVLKPLLGHPGWREWFMRMVSRYVRWTIAFSGFWLIALSVGPSLAAPPELTACFPAGAARGTEVRVALQGKITATELEFWSSNPAVEWVAADGKDAVKLKVAPEAPLGVVWLAFHNAEGVSAQRPFVIGELPEQLEQEPNDGIALTGSPLPLPVVMNGTLGKSGDVDTYGVELKAGETLVALVEALQTLGSPLDGLVQIADSRGFVLLQNDDAQGFDPRLLFTAPRDDRYFVRVFAFPSQPNSTIQFAGGANYIYRLTLASGPVVTQWSPAAVTLGGPVAIRRVGTGGSDALPAMERQFEAVGMIPLLGEGVVALAPIQATPHPVVISTSENSKDSPQTVTLPATMVGRLEQPQSSQGWKFAATKGLKLRLRLASSALASPLDAVVRVFDPSGKQLLEIDDAKKDEFEIDTEFNPPVDAEYLVSVSERFWHGGPSYLYTLTVAPSEPEVILTVASNSFQVEPSKTLEIPMTVERRFGMNEPLTVALENPPEGISAEPVVSEVKGDSAKKVTLKIKCERTEPWLGAIQIVGQTAGDMPLVARTTIDGSAGSAFAPGLLLKSLPPKSP